MIKLIIFDLDGVLVDARELHYEALNRALCDIDKTYAIGINEHLSTYDGLPTTKKLNMLTKNKGLPKEMHNKVWEMKQTKTIEIIKNEFQYDNRIIQVLKKLKDDGYKICVASNSIRETVKMMLLKRGFMEYIDFFFSNQDVFKPKPSSEIYLRCAISAGVDIKECLIIEDSHIGRRAAFNSGAHLYGIENSGGVVYDKIRERINMIEKKGTEFKPRWQGGDLNVLIPMAGRGSRFKQAGYTFPKPLIEVNGKPMIQLVVDNLNIDANYIFIVLKEHYEKYNLQYLLNLICPSCRIVQVEGITEGAACTTLLAKEFIDNDDKLLIANSDQFVEWESNEFMYAMVADNVDAGMLTFKSVHSKWSFAKLDDNGFVCEVAEKKPISDNATVGIYYWSKGSDYIKYAEEMIKKDIRTNNEFYVCPVFNEAILDSKKVKIYEIKKMWGLGTPEDLRRFLDNKVDK